MYPHLEQEQHHPQVGKGFDPMGVRYPPYAVGAGEEYSGEKPQDMGFLRVPAEGKDEGCVNQEEFRVRLDPLEGSGEARCGRG